MRWQTLVGLILIGASGYVGWDLMQDSKSPWPAYAAPNAECGLQLAKAHEGTALRFQYPEGWNVKEASDKQGQIVQTFLEPPGGKPHEVMLFLREMQARLSAYEVPAPGSPGAKLRDAPADAPAAPPGAAAPPPAGQEAPSAGPAQPVRLDDTQQALQLGNDRNGSAYLTRLEEAPQKVSYSWMAFVWDKNGRSTVVSGPKLVHSNWPQLRKHDRELNCAFWTVLKTVEAK